MTPDVPPTGPAKEESYHPRQDKQLHPVAGGSIASLYHLSLTRLISARNVMVCKVSDE